MPLIQILIVLVVVGVLLWLVNRFIPMQGTIKSILNAVVVIGVVLWLLNVFGLFPFPLPHPRRDVSEPGGMTTGRSACRPLGNQEPRPTERARGA